MNMFRVFMELDEAYNDRHTLIDTIKKSGKNYNFDKYTDAQLYRMVQRLQQPRVATKEPAHELDLDFETRDIEHCEFCNTQLTDFGQCPKCALGDEDLREWQVHPRNTTPPAATSNVSSTPAAQPMPQTPKPHLPSGRYAVRIVSDHGRLRALGTDGIHPAAWVAFPNDLRQFDGQQYEVDQLIWNGKNYRVAGNIIEI